MKLPLVSNHLRHPGTATLSTANKRLVNDEFDRVAAAFRSIAAKQQDQQRTNTEAILAILEEKRAEVMSREQAGYFIHDWQEMMWMFLGGGIVCGFFRTPAQLRFVHFGQRRYFVAGV